MAGKRREAGKPLIKDVRGERRRAVLNVKLARTHSPRDRVALAADYLRGALLLQPDPNAAEEAVTRLIEAADRLYARKENSR
jgi:hypothetical protein